MQLEVTVEIHMTRLVLVSSYVHAIHYVLRSFLISGSIEELFGMDPDIDNRRCNVVP
jgi:hypothetical protein